jgi:SOS-response transcriptional repressor LexA
MSEFTPTQGRYLAYIHAYTEGFGLPPAESEIAAAIGVSPPSVNQMMKVLEKKSLIQRQPKVPRSIKILVAHDLIPKWKGKRISRTVWEWSRSEPPKHRCRTVQRAAGRHLSLQGHVAIREASNLAAD